MGRPHRLREKGGVFMRVLTVILVSTAVVLGLSLSAGAQSSTLLDEPLTKASNAFDESAGGDVAVLKFGKGGMTVAGIEKGNSLYLAPSIPGATQDQLLNVSTKVTALPGNKSSFVGLYCRRSDANGGYVFDLRGKHYEFFEHDSFGKVKLLSEGTVKSAKPGKPNVLEVQCAKSSADGFGMIAEYRVNGKRVFSRLVQGSPQLGGVGLFLDSGGGSNRGLATFRDLTIEELAPPTS